MSLAIAVGRPAFAADQRTWTDRTGKFKMQAEFVGEASGVVTLKGSDGKEFEIALTKLSAGDQTYVRSLRNSSPAASRPGSTSPPTDTKSVETPRGTVDDTGEYHQRIVRPDHANCRELNLFNTGDGWQVDPESLARPADPDYSGKPMKIPAKSDFFERCRRMQFNSPLTHAVIGYTLDGSTRGIGTTRVTLIDLAAKRSVANATTGGSLLPLALGRDGRSVVMRSNGDDEDRLELWTIQGSKAYKAEAWKPSEQSASRHKRIDWAAFAADGKLLTAGGEEVIAWTLEPLTPVWKCAVAYGCRPALSPSGKQLLVADKEQLALIDLEQEKIVAAMPVPKGNFPMLSFSPSGRRFAADLFGTVYVWESATGELYRELETRILPPLGNDRVPIFANEDQLLLGEVARCLVDLPSQIPLWDYRRADTAAQGGDAVYFVAGDGSDKDGVLFGAKLPQPQVTEALEQAAADPETFLFKRGSTVKLDLSRLTDPAERATVQTAIEAKLAEREVKVDPAAAVVLAGWLDPPKATSGDYHGFGERATVSFNDSIAHLELQWQGQIIWQSAGGNMPCHVNRRAGESIQDAIRRYEKPNYAFFKGVTLPKLIMRPTEGKIFNLLGTSRVTTKGIY